MIYIANIYKIFHTLFRATMNYEHLLTELQKASMFDLYRLNIAIKNELENPIRIKQIQDMVKVSQQLSYYDQKTNKLRPAILLQKNPKYALALDLEDKKQWNIHYFLLNLQNVDTRIYKPDKKLDKNSLSVGDNVRFIHQDSSITGKITRLNFKTVTLIDTHNRRWRVGYSQLQSFIDVEQIYDVNLIE